MLLNINKNIYLKSFETEKELKESILDMIIKSKTDKILYKGDPKLINYKTIKKIILNKKEKDISCELIKEKYSKIIEKIPESFCMIYKD
jgi:hypothetical protein